MESIRTLSSVRAFSSSWSAFQREITHTDKTTLNYVVHILRHNPQSLDRPDLRIDLPAISHSQEEKIKKIISSVFQLKTCEESRNFAHVSGYNEETEFAQALLEQALWDVGELVIAWDSLCFVLFFTEKTDLPTPLPDVIGTQLYPGELSVKIQGYLQELQEQHTSLMENLENEINITKKQKIEGGWTKKQKLEKELSELSSVLQERKHSWECVKKCIQEAHPLRHFPSDFSQRQAAYCRFAYRLNMGFDSLKSRGLQLQFFAQDGGIADLPQVCYTGWFERIEAMLEGSEQKQGMIQKAHLFARDLRRSIMQSQVLTAALRDQGYRENDIERFSVDVHYRQAIKQWANERFTLGYSQEELGGYEIAKVLLSNSFQAVAQAVMEKAYTANALSSILIEEFRQMTYNERESLVNELLTAYRNSCQQDCTLLLDSLDEERGLYEEMNAANELEEPYRLRTLGEIRKKFEHAGIKPPFSLATLYEKLKEELKIKYPSQAFKVFSKFGKNTPECERIKAFQKAFQALQQELKDPELEVLLERIETCDFPQMQKKHLQRQKKEIAECAHGFENYRIGINVSRLERKVHSGSELHIFGSYLWLCSAKILFPSDSPNTEADKSQQILQWAYKQYKILSSEQVMQKVQEEPGIYRILPKSFQEIPQVREYVRINPWLRYGASSQEEFEKYRSLSPQILNLDDVPQWVKECKEIILALVKQDALALECASEALRNDREIVLTAIEQDPEALQYASIELKSDREIVLSAVVQDSTTLQYACTELKNDKEIVLAAIEQDGTVLEYVSERLKDDYQVVLKAVKQDGNALLFASSKLRNDKEIVLIAVAQDPTALECASAELQNNKEVVLAAVIQDAVALEYASAELKNDKEVVLAAITQNAMVLEFVSSSLKDDKEVVLAAVCEDGRALQYASNKLKDDKEIVIKAIGQEPSALEYASAKLKSDQEVLLAANN